MIVQTPDNKNIDFGDMPPEQVQTAMQKLYPPQQQPSMMDQATRQLGLGARYMTNFVTGVPGMIGDAANTAVNGITSGVNAIAGTNIPPLQMPSQLVQQGLTKIGMPEPNTPTERVVGDISTALANTGSTMGMAGALSRAAPVIAPLAENPIMQARAAIGAGGAAGSVREMGGGPIAQGIAGLAGGFGATRGMSEAPQQNLSQKLRSQASDAYADATERGGILSPKFTDSWLSDAADQVSEPESVTRAFGNTPVQKVIEGLQTEYAGKPINLDEATAIDKRLTQEINKQVLPTGKLNEVGKQLNDIQTNFRNMIDTAGPEDIAGGKDGFDALNQGRQLWAQSARARDIEQIMNRADMMDVPATSLRAGFRTLANNQVRLRGFTPEQQDLIKQAANISMPVEVLRGLGSRLISAVAAGTGHIGGSLLAQGGSKVARDFATQMQMNRAQAILDNIGGAQSASKMPRVPFIAGTAQGIYGAQR